MRKLTYVAAGVLVAIAISNANAQCSRDGGGGGGGTATGIVTPVFTSMGFGSPLASRNPINTSPSASFLAAQYRSQLAQYQNMLAQQQRSMQMMAQRQQILEQQIQQLQKVDGTSSAEQVTTDRVTNRENSSQERRRQQNAEKAFRSAVHAAASGRTSTARSRYRRVIRIVGPGSELGSRASDALAALSGDNGRDKTMLVSAKGR